MSKAIEETTWVKWKRKRTKTFIGYIIVGVVVGIDYSVIFSTLYLYLRDTIKTENNEVYYGLIIAAYSVSSSAFGMITGRWLDKTRRVKLYTNVTLMLQVVGSILYIIPYHVAFPLVGRFIAGSGDPFTNVCTGEVVRIYNEKESTRALWWLASCYSIGLVIGPVIPLTFSGIEFKLGPIPVNEYNFIGILMASLLVIAFFIVNFLIHDCSKEIDLKEYLKEQDLSSVIDKDTDTEITIERENSVHDKTDGTLLIEEDIPVVITKAICDSDKSASMTQQEASSESFVKDRKIPSVTITLRRLMSNVDVALLFISSFICMYCMFAVDVLIPLIFLVILEWDFLALVIFFVGSGVIYALILFLMSKFCNTSKSLYNTMLFCLVSEVLMFLFIIAIKFNKRYFVVDVILVSILAVFWLLTTCTEEVLIRAILARKVPSPVQSFTESIRNGVSNVATVIAAISTPLILPFVEWWALAMMVVSGLLLIAYLVRRSSMINAKEIDFDPNIKC